ncbi:hypothetical protein [Ruegeria meonggei]|uniref:hypothetical protein n=1 Tax=Ruegeria meonggei TaxID=1446476 RepID=UPI00366C04A0
MNWFRTKWKTVLALVTSGVLAFLTWQGNNTDNKLLFVVVIWIAVAVYIMGARLMPPAIGTPEDELHHMTLFEAIRTKDVWLQILRHRWLEVCLLVLFLILSTGWGLLWMGALGVSLLTFVQLFETAKVQVERNRTRR